MGSLIILYVTKEQKTAIGNLYDENGWIFENLERFLSEHQRSEVLLTLKSSVKDGYTATYIDDGHRIVQGAEDELEEIAGDQQSEKLTNTHCDVTEKFSAANDTEEITKAKRERKKCTHSKKAIRTVRVRSICETRKAAVVRNNLRNESPLPDKPVDRKKSPWQQSVVDIHEDRTERKGSGDESIENESVIESDFSVEGKGDGLEKKLLHKQMKFIPKQESDKLKCSKCSYLTNIRSNLNRHVREMHSGMRYSCTKCDKTFKAKHDAKVHEMLGHTAGLGCKECDKTFTSTSGLRNHIKIKHKKSNLYQCKHCDKKFYYKSHYLGHVNKHLDLKPFNCETCKKPFRYKVACHLHEKTCSRENFFLSHNSDGSLKATTKPKFLCDLCGLELTTKSGLRVHHYYTHTKDTTTVCSLCGKSFKGTYSLQRHIRNIHENCDVMYPCPECGKQFSQQQILKQHIKIHKKAYTSFCETCGKGFLSRFKMIEHTRMHTGEKPFSCPHCQSFKCATKTNLRKHLKIHEEGRIPRQKKDVKRQRIKTTPKADKRPDIGIDKGDASVNEEDVFIPSPIRVDSQFKLVRNTRERDKYTNLPQLRVENSENDSSRGCNYDQSVGNQFINNRAQYDGTHRTSEMERVPDYLAYHVEAGDNKVTNCYRLNQDDHTLNNDHSTYIVNTSGDDFNVENDVRNQADVSQVSQYYSNDSPEIPQGLNILTVAMNIVNPSEF